MKKLQLYITKSLRGFKSLINFNPDEDIRQHVEDVRKALEIPQYDPAEKNMFYMLRQIDGGMFVIVLRTIPSEPLDHLAAWIFIPNSLKINADELTEIVRLTTRKVAAPSLTPEDRAELRTAYATEYDEGHDAPFRIPCSGSEYAFRYYGGDRKYELSDFLGDEMYQIGYRNYAGILLIDASLGVEGKGTDITDEPLVEMVSVNPPVNGMAGFEPTIYGVPFTRPMLLPANEDIEIVWRRQGCEPLKQSVKIEPGVQITGIQTDSSRKTISRSSFLITALSGKQKLTDECFITVNGLDINQPRSFTLAELRDATVTVACEGFYTHTARFDLANAAQTIIHLRERQKIYNFEISAKSAEIAGMINFTIRSKNELSESPIEGYSLSDDIQEGESRSNHLIYNGSGASKSLMEKLLWAAGGLLIGILLTALFTCSSSHDGASATPAETEQQTDETANATNDQAAEAQPETPSETPAVTTPADSTQAQAVAEAKAPSLDDAVHYLDANRVWTKHQLDSFPDLVGLYEDMNNIERRRLVEHWAPKLTESRQFKLVSTHARLSYHKKARLKPGRNTFNPDNDQSINIQTYLNTIDP